MITAEQRYQNAIRKARIRATRDLRRFMVGELPILATSDFEKQALIGAIQLAYAAGAQDARAHRAGP